MNELPPLIGRSPAFLAAMAEISRLALVRRPVLVIGERGTGKELVAARLHYLSPAWNRPFLAMNCAALPETLLEAELFGSEAGAFTGAQRRRPGRFERAHTGTLFLDEIADAPLAVQEALLRVAEYGRFERVGGGETVSVDVRLIAATHADLPARVSEGRFRADLLDRLAFEVITLPPLRERPEDIEPLAEHTALEMTKFLKREVFPGFTPAAMERLHTHTWPGNVRELRNVVERAVGRTLPSLPVDAGQIVLDPFASLWRPSEMPRPAPPVFAEPPLPAAPYDLTATLRAFERERLADALARHRGRQKPAAAFLGLGYHQFRHALARHGLIGRPER